MIEITFYNSLTREKEIFKPINDKKVAMYSCGPTGYNYAHIGNFRAYIFSDLVRRVLEDFGYEVKLTRAGYFLEKDLKDSLFPWEFGAEEELFFHFPETESTMTEARKIAQENSFSKKMEIITADKQTKGQGHSSHKWTTTKDSLACTLITRSGIAVSYSHRATMAAQIAIVKTLTEMTGRKFYARWPNDIWSENG